jgi:hypothetical protein
MNSTGLIKRSCLRIGLVTVLVSGTLLFSGCTKQLGEAQIVVYENGEEIVVDTQSPYFKKLQAACEEMLTSAESLYLVDEQEVLAAPETIKNEDWVIEVSYVEPIEVVIPVGIGPTAALQMLIKVSEYDIPLTGGWSQIRATGVKSFDEGAKDYVCLLLFPEIVIGEGRWESLIGTKKDVQEIKDILARLDVNVP